MPQDYLSNIIQVISILISIYFGVIKDRIDIRLRREALIGILRTDLKIDSFHKEIYKKIPVPPNKIFSSIMAIITSFFILSYLFFAYVLHNTSLFSLPILKTTLYFNILILFLLLAYSIFLVTLPGKIRLKSLYMLVYLLLVNIMMNVISLIIISLNTTPSEFKSLESPIKTMIITIGIFALVIAIFVVPFQIGEIFRDLAKSRINKYRDTFPNIRVRLKDGQYVEGKLTDFLSRDYIEIEDDKYKKFIFWNEIRDLWILKEENKPAT